MDGAADRVFYGQHSGVGQPLSERLKCHFKLLAGQRFCLGACFARCSLAVCPRRTLIGNPIVERGGCLNLHRNTIYSGKSFCQRRAAIRIRAGVVLVVGWGVGHSPDKLAWEDRTSSIVLLTACAMRVDVSTCTPSPPRPTPASMSCMLRKILIEV